MFARNRSNSRGDTLIEVLFATAVFGVVAVGSLNVMNQGLSTSQRALEVALVRQEIDAQAETLRFLNSAYATAYNDGAIAGDLAAQKWQPLMGNGFLNTAERGFGLNTSGKCPTTAADLSNKIFIMNTHTAEPKLISSISLGGGFSNDSSQEITPQVEYNADNSIKFVHGIWVEAVKVAGSGVQYSIDFHIRACWDSPNDSVPITLGTIVRLYVPQL